MERFLDVVKVNLDDSIRKYFDNVEIESVKKSSDNSTLNFYLVAHDIIPYIYIKDAIATMAMQLCGVDFALESNKESSVKNPIKLNIRYKLEDIYSSKVIFDEIRNDLQREFKDETPITAVFFKFDRMSFTDDNTMSIIFDDLPELKNFQNDFVKKITDIFKTRFDRDIKVEISYKNIDYAKTLDIISEEQNELGKSDENTNVETEKPATANSETKEVITKDSTNRKKRNFLLPDGEVIFKNKNYKSKNKTKVLVPISTIVTETDGVAITGIVYLINKREIKSGLTICNVYLYDGDGSIVVKVWVHEDEKDIFDSRFKIGDILYVEGNAVNDLYDKMLLINPVLINHEGHRKTLEFNVGEEDYYNVFITDREDNERDKRVELHLHTKASTQDGIGEVSAYIETARKFGMKAMAITDHGCVNALADAYEYIEKLKGKEKDLKFKLINGVEGYLVDDFKSYYIDENGNESSKGCSFDSSFVIYNFIVTGYNRSRDSIIKIIAKKIKDLTVVDSFSELIHIDRPLNYDVIERTGVKNEHLIKAQDIKSVLNKFLDFAKDSTFVMLENNIWSLSSILKENGIDKELNIIDLSTLARLSLKELKKVTVLSTAKELKIKMPGVTDKKAEGKRVALNDTENLELACPVFIGLLNMLHSEYDASDILQLKDKLLVDENAIKRQKYYHIILLAKNDIGRVNLYKIVSDSHIHYMYNKRPRIPRSLLDKYREGIIVGSACILGEFMDAIKSGIDDNKLKEIASYYDYLEIQPTLNNSFLLNEDKDNFKDLKDLEKLNKKVVMIGEELGKPVVATCDCHYVEKEDKIYREVLRLGTSWKKTNRDKDGNIKEDVMVGLESSNAEELYFRSTREMLDEFSYLGIDKAYEVVVKNTNLINDMIEDIIPLRLDKCAPKIDGSDDDLINACKANLYKIYGDNPIKDIADRLDNELKYIIDNGYSVMYITAKKLIDYSNENGYSVGSRGSVGSSLAATLAGVSEVNPLPPHYVCPRCHHVEYETEETKKYDNDTGFDMPDKKCPECGEMMSKNGVNIPFETFLGIPGDPKAQKEPDIDLNFASVFQSKIHEKTVDIFGKANTFKAGTVGTVAANTAYGYVKNYIEYTNASLSKEQIEYYKTKIIGCKNNTGQHPGGMIVVPKGDEIYTFTPINIAADKEGNDITTHYDYHKIDKNLLKLDILGHDSPLILKKLSEATGTDFNTIPFYEDKVLSLFKNTDSLGISPSDISGTRLGCLSIPEFGTDFAMGMCEDAKPNTVADLIRIAGLAHGTDVWQGNVKDYIKNGDCTLSTAICCRDDIMIYLIEKGLDKGLAFNIMESVRKGRGLSAEWIDEMKKHDVPDWYIGCCKKIKYMFPKAHAAAYVLSSLRIAYYKIHFPKEYYAVYFSVRKDGIDYKLMMQSKESIHHQIEKIRRVKNEKNLDDEYYGKLSKKNLDDLFMCYRVVEEMKARGIDFCPIDIYKAKRSDFQVIDDMIMPSFDSIPGIGVKDEDLSDDIPLELKSTAMKCEIEGQRGEYTSIENFKKRTGVSKTIIAEMKEEGLFNGMKEDEVNTLFDYLK